MPYKLPKVFTEKWLSALRSGAFKQGEKFLYCNVNGYCCIGVAGVCAGISTDVMRHLPYLTPRMVSGLEIPEIFLKMNDFTEQLAKLNDVHHYSFAQIADWVEKNCEFI